MAVSGTAGTPAAVGSGSKIPSSKLLLFTIKSFRKSLLTQLDSDATKIRKILVGEMENLPAKMELISTSSLETSIRHLRLAHEVLSYGSKQDVFEEAIMAAELEFCAAFKSANKAFTEELPPIQRILATKVLIDSTLHLDRHDTDGAIQKCITFLNSLVDEKEVSEAYSSHFLADRKFQIFNREERWQIVNGVWEIMDTVMKVISELVPSLHHIQSLPHPTPFDFSTSYSEKQQIEWFSKMLEDTGGNLKSPSDVIQEWSKKWLLPDYSNETNQVLFSKPMEIVEEKWENQKLGLTGWGKSGDGQGNGPPAWSSEDFLTDRENVELPDGWRWKGEWKFVPTATGNSGWVFTFNGKFRGSRNTFTRSRKWARVRRKQSEDTTADGEKEELFPPQPYDRLYEPTNHDCNYRTMISECRALIKGISDHLWSFLVVAKKLPGILAGPAIKPFTNYGVILAVREYTEFVETKKPDFDGEVDDTLCSVCEQEFTIFGRFRYDCSQCQQDVCDDCCVEKQPFRVCLNCSRRADAERRSELYEIFDYLDSDDDGQISIGELKNGLKRVDCDLKLDEAVPSAGLVNHDDEYQLNFMEFVEIAETRTYIMPALKKLQTLSVEMLDAKFWECPFCKTRNPSQLQMCSNDVCDCLKSQVEERVKERLGIIIYIGPDCTNIMETFWKRDFVDEILQQEGAHVEKPRKKLSFERVHGFSTAEFKSKIQQDEVSQLSGEVIELRRQLSATQENSQRRQSEVSRLTERCQYLENEIVEQSRRGPTSTWDKIWNYISPISTFNCTPDSYDTDADVAMDTTCGGYEFTVVTGGVCYRNSPRLSDCVDPKDGVHLNERVEAHQVHGDDWIQLYNGLWLPLKIDGETLLEQVGTQEVGEQGIDL